MKQKAKHTLSTRSRNELQAYLMLSPQIIGFLLFSIYPLMWAIRLSWFFYNGIDTQTRFTGWENFIKLLTDETYWKALGNTFLFFFMKFPRWIVSPSWYSIPSTMFPVFIAAASSAESVTDFSRCFQIRAVNAVVSPLRI